MKKGDIIHAEFATLHFGVLQHSASQSYGCMPGNMLDWIGHHLSLGSKIYGVGCVEVEKQWLFGNAGQYAHATAAGAGSL